MTVSIQMLKDIADCATAMANAMQAVVEDCIEQRAQQKAAAETGVVPPAEIPEIPENGSVKGKPDDQPPITIVELRAFVAERSTPETRPLIKEILTKHGVKKLTELHEDQYRSVMETVGRVCGK